MKQRVVQEQRLQQKMSYSLIQAIHILQLSSTELLEYLQELALENPVLEDIPIEKEFPQEIESVKTPIENWKEQPLSFYDQLKEQLLMVELKTSLVPVIHYGIDSLNENGYLTISLEEWAQACAVSDEQVNEALSVIQSLEPAGIGARTLTECILLQLKSKKTDVSFIEELLTLHLEWVADENLTAIMNKYHITKQESIQIIQSIKSCHPKPGQLLSPKKPEYIIPEANVYKDNGQWKLSFYKWSSIEVKINQDYRAMKDSVEEAKDYLNEKLKEVEWLQQVIRYRFNTMEKVIQKIVEKQLLFFEHGPYMLKPLTLKELAEELNLNISTISRTVSHKFLQTTYGVVPLNFFFQSGIRQQDGKQTSSFAVKQLIHELIQFEDKHKPFSDETIRKRLNQEFGIMIARRTVMKYREQMGLPSSLKRKIRKD